MASDPEDDDDAHARWPALESNPENFSEFIATLGIDIENIGVHDVFGFDPELLMMIPQPIYAMVFLFPTTRRKAIQSKQTGVPAKDVPLFFLRQTTALGNACGTIACIHALTNNRSSMPFGDDSVLGKYYAAAKDETPAKRGKILESFEPIREEQVKASQSSTNQTEATEDEVDYHFVCFIEREGRIYEMDGGRTSPLDHGPVSEDLGFAASVGAVIQKEYMARMPDELNFATLAIAANA